MSNQSQFYVVASIGRNVDGVPMSVSRWTKFQDELKATLEAHITLDLLLFTGTGSGVWAGYENESDTVEHEEGFTVTLIAHSVDTGRLRPALSEVAQQFEQEAIGLVITAITRESDTLVSR